jgi:Family of unknown function (DUF6488)
VNIRIVLAALAAACASPATHADVGGSCHFHGNKPAAEATVAGCASQRKDKLVKDGKLDSTWQPVKHDKAELVDGKKGKEWRVTFRHPSPKDKAQETLYLFFTPVGNFIAANFSGH